MPELDFKFTGNFKFLFEFSWKDRQMQLTVRGGERWRINTFILSYSAKFRGLGVRALGAAPHFSLQTSVEHSWQFIPIHPGKLFILPVSTQLFILFSVSLSLSVSPSPLLLPWLPWEASDIHQRQVDVARVASACLLLSPVSGWPFLRVLLHRPETSVVTQLKISSYRWDK